MSSNDNRSRGTLQPPFALISDIHSNLPALDAVLRDIESRGIERVVCLGDIVGYGPDPYACWQLVRARCSIMIRGNHDQALGAEDLGNFHPRARSAIQWTRDQLLDAEFGPQIIKTLINLPRSARVGKYLFVHGSPVGPTMEYLLPGDSYDKPLMAREFARVPAGGVAFNGHTHIPGVIIKGSRFLPPEALSGEKIELLGRQAIINVGSVGQPRDGNPLSCYATVDMGDVVTFHRVEYDAESVCKRILAIKDLDPFLGQRLLAGY